MISGIINFNEKRYLFTLEEFNLELKEINENGHTLTKDLINFFRSEVEFPSTLRGKDLNSQKEIIFHVGFMSSSVNFYRFKVFSYIVFENQETSCDALEVNSEELNWFYNVRNAYDWDANIDNGGASFHIKPFEETQKYFSFTYGEQKVVGNLNITRKIKNMDTAPLLLHTALELQFGEISDYDKLLNLIDICYKFMMFISYRKNSPFSKIILKKRISQPGKYRKIAQVFINWDDIENHEEEEVVRERLIDFPIIENGIGSLFQILSNEKVYLSHIPKSLTDGRRKTAARFIMITAGFEWQFRITYGEESDKSEDIYAEAQKEVMEFLNQKVDSNTGKKKKYFKGLIKSLYKNNMTLSDKIRWALDEFSAVLEPFNKSLFYMNKEVIPQNKDIAERLATQRNNYAHGNIDKELNTLVILDLLVLEWLYYAMVLREIGISDLHIQLAINKLFARRIAL